MQLQCLLICRVDVKAEDTSIASETQLDRQTTIHTTVKRAGMRLIEDIVILMMSLPSVFSTCKVVLLVTTYRLSRNDT